MRFVLVIVILIGSYWFCHGHSWCHCDYHRHHCSCNTILRYLYYSLYLIILVSFSCSLTQAPKSNFRVKPYFGGPGSPGTATEEPKSPLWWPTSTVTSTPCERTWWWSLWQWGLWLAAGYWISNLRLVTGNYGLNPSNPMKPGLWVGTWIPCLFLGWSVLQMKFASAIALATCEIRSCSWGQSSLTGTFTTRTNLDVPSQRFKVHKATHSRLDLADAWETWLS